MRPLIALATAALVAGSVAGCSSSGGSPAASPSTTASLPTTTAQSGSAGVPTATASPTGGFERAQEWFSGVQGYFAAIQTGTEQIKAAAARNDAAALPNLCRVLGNNVVKVNDAPAAPDKRLAQAVGAAMTAYKSAAQSCLTGDFGATATGINQGAQYLQQANDIMNNLS
jgi:hypothetical protein